MTDENERDETEVTNDEVGLSRGTVKVAALGRPPKIVTLPDDREATIADLIDRGFLQGGDDVQYFLNSRQVDTDAIVKNGDMIVSIDNIDAG